MWRAVVRQLSAQWDDAVQSRTSLPSTLLPPSPSTPYFLTFPARRRRPRVTSSEHKRIGKWANTKTNYIPVRDDDD